MLTPTRKATTGLTRKGARVKTKSKENIPQEQKGLICMPEVPLRKPEQVVLCVNTKEGITKS